VLLLYCRDTARVARSEKARARLRSVYQALFKILPHTPLELLCFLALSLTAGFCEEFLFRGYLIWFLQPGLGWWGAAGVAALVFAVGHSYQGLSGILRTGILGIIMTLVFFITRSLWPAIALHALIDIGSGVMGWLILRESIGPDEMRPVAA
jgi:CAAX protease family protein